MHCSSRRQELAALRLEGNYAREPLLGEGFTARHDVVEYWDSPLLKVFHGKVGMKFDDPSIKPVRPTITHFVYMDEEAPTKVKHDWMPSLASRPWIVHSPPSLACQLKLTLSSRLVRDARGSQADKLGLDYSQPGQSILCWLWPAQALATNVVNMIRRLIKFLHTIGAIGLMGAMACLIVLLGLAPKPTLVSEYALMSAAMSSIVTWIFLPSLALTLIAGLLAIAVNRAYHSAGWAWAKISTGGS
jgi:hypothetical protein